MMQWPAGLDRRPKEAKAFYATIAVATLGSIALSFTALNPIRALYWSAVIWHTRRSAYGNYGIDGR